jgi:hypothetical protein
LTAGSSSTFGLLCGPGRPRQTAPLGTVARRMGAVDEGDQPLNFEDSLSLTRFDGHLSKRGSLTSMTDTMG